LRELMARLSHAEQEQAWTEIEHALTELRGIHGGRRALVELDGHYPERRQLRESV
jgi:hypothetical protein